MLKIKTMKENHLEKWQNRMMKTQGDDQMQKTQQWDTNITIWQYCKQR